ncbi:VOC family protein [Eubacterium maltosivorans]|uniref:VOC family protein n=1 Tax=Eubacterium maltosivorans TaxID=2041044 RepID=UPI003A9385F8
MTGVEIDMVVTDSLKALELYEKIYEVERVEVTDYPKGTNEAVFTIYDTRFHLLDENPEYQLIAPKPGQPQSVWYNVLVPDILTVYDKAMTAGCTAIQQVTEMPEMGAANAMFADPFGYVWMLHQIHREVSFEDRCRVMEEKQE